MEGLYNDLKLYIPSIDLSEIEELDIVCKCVIKKMVAKPDNANTSSLIKIEAVRLHTYEKINIGDWHSIKVYLRKTMTVTAYLKLLNKLKLIMDQNLQVNDKNMKELFNIIDDGIIFGCPLQKEPQLLQKCASKVKQVIDNNLKVIKINLNNFCENSTPIPSIENVKLIEVISCPSMETFYCNYISKNQPVILEGCINHWPALTKWKDHNYIYNVAGMRMVPIETGAKYTDQEWSQSIIRLRHFMKEYIFNPENTVKGYLAQYQLFDQIPELREDIAVPEYCCFSETHEPVDINAWYGPKGTVSPLHYDPKKNLLAQVIGEKSIFLFDYADAPYLYPYEGKTLQNTARVDPRVNDHETFPEYKKARPYHGVLRPGQMLFIPPKWWHFVESLSISFSVSFWWT